MQTKDWKLQSPYQLHRADSGALELDLIYRRVNNISESPIINLLSKECPHIEVCSIEFRCSTCKIVFKSSHGEFHTWAPKSMIPLKSQKVWLSWYNDEICMGIKNEPRPFLVQRRVPKGNSIGFIKLNLSARIDWVIKSPSVPITPLTYRHIEGGKLHWTKISNNKLPPDALIGGYENEPIYIARANHNGSLCPGKYVPSKGCAYLPWGSVEYEIHDFEILCGYDAIWMKCKENYVPETAFIAGKSEIIGEHLCIGRAMINTDLVVGKVHMLFKTCYLPYNGIEVQRYTYEILVKGDVVERGVRVINKCQWNPMKALQPCI